MMAKLYRIAIGVAFSALMMGVIGCDDDPVPADADADADSDSDADGDGDGDADGDVTSEDADDEDTVDATPDAELDADDGGGGPIEICDNELDDDDDGATDCDDSDCDDDTACAHVPRLPRTAVTDVADAANFLYTGVDAVQQDVEPGAIDPRRVTILRGSVTDASGTPLEDVRVTVHRGEPFGHTFTGPEGVFDMAVNGGGRVTVAYSLEGYLTANRSVFTRWQTFTWVPDVVLIPEDTAVTTVDSGASEAQVARGSVMDDGDGERQATMIFPSGVTANALLPDGSETPIASLSVRATEYTVGESGPQTMPAQLPPTSGYTYAVELRVDEAVALGATDVRFSDPIGYYVENFLDFPVGTTVPVGAYDEERALWIPSESGVVVEIVAEAGGLASMDMDGDGEAESDIDLEAAGIDIDERQHLATLYEPGQTLWRAPVTHFSTWDHNWPFGPPEDAESPDAEVPEDAGAGGGCTRSGSIIVVDNQTLAERFEIVGTPYALRYQTDRTPGYTAAYSLDVRLTGDDIPASLKAVVVDAQIAGQRFEERHTAGTNLYTDINWDGRDCYGRLLQGRQEALVRVGYVYDGDYRNTGEFGAPGEATITGSLTREEVTLWAEFVRDVGLFDASVWGLGGFNFDVHHVYDPVNQILYLGDGTSRRAEGQGRLVEEVHDWSEDPLLGSPDSVLVAPDGSLYVTDDRLHGVIRLDSDGIRTIIAGTGIAGFSGDGGLAADAQFDEPQGMALSDDGTLYISDAYNARVRVIRPDGIVMTFAGGGAPIDNVGDGGPATEAELQEPDGIALGPDGSLYICDADGDRVRRVDPRGNISTFAGGGAGGDGGLASEAEVLEPSGITVAADGTVYFTERVGDRVRRVTPDGIITTIAGTGIDGFSGDGGPATVAEIDRPRGIALAFDGSVLFADENNGRVRIVTPDGVINSILGGGGRTTSLGSFGTRLEMARDLGLWSADGIAFGHDGSLLVADGSWSMYRVFSGLPGSASDTQVLPSDDGAQLFVFDAAGHHLETRDALTGVVLLTFEYDEAFQVTAITDENGLVTEVRRDPDVNMVEIVAPHGQQTQLDLVGGRLAMLTDPLGRTVDLGYDASGLLTSMTDRRGGAHSYAYDAMGRLLSDEGADGHVQSLNRTSLASGHSVTVSTLLDRETTYTFETIGELQQASVTGPDGITTDVRTDGTLVEYEQTDGSLIELLLEPDPRWGMEAPYVGAVTVTTPEGRSLTAERTVTVSLDDPFNPFTLQDYEEDFILAGRHYVTTWDASSRELFSRWPSGRRVETTFDEQGRIVTTGFRGMATINYEYDTEGRRNRIVWGSGAEAREYLLSYSDDGFLETFTDQRGLEFTSVRDVAGRLLSHILPDLEEVVSLYDEHDNLVSLTPPGRDEHIFAYDASDHLIRATPPTVPDVATPETEYTYNLDRQLTNIDYPDGRFVDVGYDSGGRIATLTSPRGTVTRSYDELSGELSSITTEDGDTLSFDFDGPLVLSQTWTGEVSGEVTWLYDDNLLVSETRVNGTNTVSYSYDEDRLVAAAGAEIIERDNQTALPTQTVVEGVTVETEYNDFGEVVSIVADYAGAELYNITYGRDGGGRVTSISETIDGDTHETTVDYGPDGRLQLVVSDGTTQFDFTYDQNGNRLSDGNPLGADEGTYDAQDRAVTYGPWSFTYTANGELESRRDLISGGVDQYEYDVWGNLRSVSVWDGTEIEYVVDGLNRRFGRRVDDVLVQGLLYGDGLGPVAELDGSGAVITRFVYGTSDRIPDYLIRGGEPYRIITDALGSVRLVVNAVTGEIVQRMEHDVFGRVLEDTAPGFQPFGYAGGLYDGDTGLVRFGSRDYDPILGRWTARDPIGFAGRDPNLYSYVGMDPLNFVDPDGLRRTGGVCNAALPPDSRGGPIHIYGAGEYGPGSIRSGRHPFWVFMGKLEAFAHRPFGPKREIETFNDATGVRG